MQLEKLLAVSVVDKSKWICIATEGGYEIKKEKIRINWEEKIRID